MTIEINKLALTNAYDKRALTGGDGEYDDVYTKAWGHYSLDETDNN